MTTFNHQLLMQFLTSLKGMLLFKIEPLQYHITEEAKKTTANRMQKTPAHTGQKRASQQETWQSAKVHINENYQKVYHKPSLS